MNSARQQCALFVSFVCKECGVDAENVKAWIFGFLDDFPRALVAGCLDGTALLFRFYGARALTDEPPMYLSHPTNAAVHSVVVASLPHGHVVATGCGDGCMRIFSLEGELLSTLQAYEDTPVYSVQLQRCHTSDMMFAATSTGEHYFVSEGAAPTRTGLAHLWTMGSSAALTSTSRAAPHLHNNRVVGFAHRFGVNGIVIDTSRRLAATASDDRTARLFDFDGKCHAICEHHTSFVWEVALDVRLDLLATACEDGFARLFDFHGSLIAAFGCGAGCCEVAIDAHDRAILATSADATVRLWSVDSFESLAVAHHGADTEVHCAASLLRYGRLFTGTENGDLVEWKVDKSHEPYLMTSIPKRLFDSSAVTVAIG